MSIEADLERTTRQRDYAARLAAVLGNGADWEFHDEVAEDPQCQGQCACGHHGLRWMFTIRNPKTSKAVVVGSSCIRTYRSVNPQLVADINAAVDRINRELAEAKAKARKAEQDGRVRRMLGDWDRLLVRIDELTGQGRWNPKVDVPEGADPTLHWRILSALGTGKLGRLKTARGKIDLIEKYVKKATDALDRIETQNRRRAGL